LIQLCREGEGYLTPPDTQQQELDGEGRLSAQIRQGQLNGVFQTLLKVARSSETRDDVTKTKEQNE
jgi:hypothetical protein